MGFIYIYIHTTLSGPWSGTAQLIAPLWDFIIITPSIMMNMMTIMIAIQFLFFMLLIYVCYLQCITFSLYMYPCMNIIIDSKYSSVCAAVCSVGTTAYTEAHIAPYLLYFTYMMIHTLIV